MCKCKCNHNSSFFSIIITDPAVISQPRKTQHRWYLLASTLLLMLNNGDKIYAYIIAKSISRTSLLEASTATAFSTCSLLPREQLITRTRTYVL